LSISMERRSKMSPSPATPARLRVALLAIPAAVLLGAAPALAVDGVVAIDQACALAGCFAGDAPGFPVEITADGSYRLTGNLSVDGVTAVTISAPRSVTLDLNGFAIKGTYACPTSAGCPGGAGYGVYSNAGLTRVTVRNGTITDIGSTGVYLGQSIGTVEDMSIGFTGGRGIDSAVEVTVRSSKILATQADGIHAFWARIFDTRVWGSHGDAIEIQDRGQVWGVETNGGLASLRLTSKLTGYANSRFDTTPIGGVNLGQNVCNSVSSGICP